MYVYFGWITDCTPKPTDLVFVLDESRSVGETNFILQIEFVAKFVDGFNIGKTTTQVAVMTFSTTMVVEFYLNKYHDKARLIQAIKHINYSHPALTFTNKALAIARTEMLNVINGRRPDALPFVIVVTDGKSSNPYATEIEAKKLHAMNVTVFAIGISSEVNETELRGIASDPKNVIIVEDFQSLKKIHSQALNGACEGMQCSFTRSLEFSLADKSILYFDKNISFSSFKKGSRRKLYSFNDPSYHK